MPLCGEIPPAYIIRFILREPDVWYSFVAENSSILMPLYIVSQRSALQTVHGHIARLRERACCSISTGANGILERGQNGVDGLANESYLHRSTHSCSVGRAIGELCRTLLELSRLDSAIGLMQETVN